MENSNDKNKDLEQENTHPAPNADPGAEIETVIPSTEKEEAPADSSKEPAEAPAKPAKTSTEPNQERVGAGDNADDIEPKDNPEIKEEEKDEPEISENEGGESKTDEHGIETISP
ncbi:hypothetical protein [Pedobacter ginsengisoli]|uniref:hypothetical protein n=1 Tax=Pedobacter ginsengisoli TaxID=363852 RepID=UPI002550E86D|nr:hypothetical protein [Pedobacter ginsengisoli]